MKTESILKELNDITNRIEVIKKQIEKPEFEVGSYWEHSTGEVCLIFGYEDIHSGTVKCRHISSDSKEFAYHGIYTMKRKLTPTEVQEALEKEAVKRGLWGDVKINAHVNPHKYESINTGDFITGFQGGDTFYNDNGAIFHNGTWATPIKTMTIDELASEISYTTKDKVVNYLTENKTKIIETLSNL